MSELPAIKALRQNRLRNEEINRRRRLENSLIAYGLSLVVIGPAFGLAVRFIATGSPT